jgi:hypothetical protein
VHLAAWHGKQRCSSLQNARLLNEGKVNIAAHFPADVQVMLMHKCIRPARVECNRVCHQSRYQTELYLTSIACASRPGVQHAPL